MGNLNCMHRIGHKHVNGEIPGDVKGNRDNSLLRNKLCFNRRRRNHQEDEKNYFSSIKIFDRQRSCNRSKGSKEDQEGNNSCPLCNNDKLLTSSEQEDGDQEEINTSNRNRSLLQPPFKSLSTPGETLFDNEVILIKVGYLFYLIYTHTHTFYNQKQI